MNESSLGEIVFKKAQIKQLESEIAELIAEEGLRTLTPGVYNEGRYIVDVTPNRRFNAKKATEMFPLGPNGENLSLYKAQVDSTLAKKFLTAEQYEMCQEEFPNAKVEVKVV